MTAATLSMMPKKEAMNALRAGSLAFDMGSVSFSVQARASRLLPFLYDQYRDCPVSSQPSLTHFNVKLDAPTMLRRYIKPQIMPFHTGFTGLLPLPLSMAALSLEMGLNLHVALGTMRHLLLHASVVADKDDQAVLMPATSGGGKSTLAGLMMEQGYRLLSDEFGIINPETSMLNAFPRPVSLKNESISVITAAAGRKSMSETFMDTPKGDIAYRRPRVEDFDKRHVPAQAKMIVFPEYTPKAADGGTVTKLKATDCLLRMIPGSTNYKMLGEQGFDCLLGLAEKTPAYAISYNSTEDSMALMRSLGVL